jgi:hypothetical protein
MSFTIDHGPRGAGELQYNIEILPTNNCYEIQVYKYGGYRKLYNSYKDCGWTNLLRDIGVCLSLNIPASNTSEYQNLLTEWADNKSTRVNTSSSPASNVLGIHYRELFRQILECAHHVLKPELQVSYSEDYFDLTLHMTKSRWARMTFDAKSKKWTFVYYSYNEEVDNCSGIGFYDLLAKLAYHDITDRISVWEYSNPDFIKEFRKYN